MVTLMQRSRERGTLTAEPLAERKPRRPAGHAERARALSGAEPDLTNETACAVISPTRA